MAECSTPPAVIAALLDAAAALGYEWGRLYVSDESDPNRLLSRRCFGLQDPEFESRFNAGLVALSRRDKTDYDAWRSLERGLPILFCGDPAIFQRLQSLGVDLAEIALVPGNCERSPRESATGTWLDVPLASIDGIQGKLVLAWTGALRVETLPVVWSLSAQAASLLGAFLARDRAWIQRDRWAAHAAERTVHSITNQLAPISCPLRTLQRC